MQRCKQSQEEEDDDDVEEEEREREKYKLKLLFVDRSRKGPTKCRTCLERYCLTY